MARLVSPLASSVSSSASLMFVCYISCDPLVCGPADECTDVCVCAPMYLLHREFQHTYSSSGERAFLAEIKGVVLRLDLDLGQV